MYLHIRNVGMDEFFKHSDYRKVILHELTVRTRRNPRYSQSAFARDIGIASNRLSEILSGKQGLSRRSAISVAQRLELAVPEQEFFCDLVDSEHARSASLRQSARHQVLSKQKSLLRTKTGSARKGASVAPLPAKLVMSWYHLTIVEFVRISKRLETAEWYCRKLDISATAAKIALQELVDHKLISIDVNSGLYLAAHNSSTVDIPAKEIKVFHEQMIAIAVKSLYSTGVDEREFNSMILPMRREHLHKFKMQLRVLVNEFADAADAETDPDLICGFSSQMFPIATIETNKA